jgi:hypothetical protein
LIEARAGASPINFTPRHRGDRHQEIDMADSPNLRFVNPSTMSKPPGYTHVVEATGRGRIV